MTQSSETETPGGQERGTGLAPALSALVEHLSALRSAWGVLAPSGLSAEKTDIAETGRTLNDDLMALIGHDETHPDLAANALLEARLDSLESEMRTIAFKVPVAQLRTTLPECVSHNRRGMLDLLDLMLGAELLGLDGTRTRIPPIDYVITLLCSASSDQPLHDPVQLTPRLHELCERTGGDYDPRLPEIEAEFFHAADMYQADARGEQQLRALQTRKAELGSGYFSPQVLRAIVTYNAALLHRIDEEVLDSLDWGSLPPVADEPQRAVSVFETPALPQIAQALRRRTAGGAPELSAVDRIAWCLDLEYPTPSERRSLLTESVDAPDDLTGTVILVGLLCRASVVLEDEFPAIGITAAELFDRWVPELSEALQQKVTQEISGDDYREACMPSELKTRFLYASMSELRRKNRTRTPAPRPDTTGAAATTGTARKTEATGTTVRTGATRKAGATGAARTGTTGKAGATGAAARTGATGKAGATGATPRTGAAGKAGAMETAGAAKPIIQEALIDARAVALRDRRPAWKDWRLRRPVAIGAALAGALLVFGVGPAFLWGGDHERFNRDQLDRVSPYLSRGARSKNGQGPAFVGGIRDSWSALPASDRTLSAADLVGTLRESGVRDVMIYDDDGLLRIQALGEQPPRLLPGLEPER